jgi:8-amino-7-oxononanoate synthase
MAPPVAAAALAALRLMKTAQSRVAALQARGELFLRLAREGGVDVGASTGLAVIPVITGRSAKAAMLSSALFQRGINAQPILHPAVPEKAARVRFFLSCLHSEEQIADTVRAVIEELAKLRG